MQKLTKREPTPEVKAMATTITWALIVLVLGTVLGVWIKFFWLGWVFA